MLENLVYMLSWSTALYHTLRDDHIIFISHESDGSFNWYCMLLEILVVNAQLLPIVR